jgi:hypothetical protein
MSKTVDRIKGNVVSVRDTKVGHVGDKSLGFDAMPVKPRVAKVNGFGVQVESRYVVPPFGQGVQ